MTDNDILDLIKAALADVAPKRKREFANISLEATVASLHLDSIATVEMVGFLEERVDATFPDEDLARLRKLNDLAVLVRSQHVAIG